MLAMPMDEGGSYKMTSHFTIKFVLVLICNAHLYEFDFHSVEKPFFLISSKRFPGNASCFSTPLASSNPSTVTLNHHTQPNDTSLTYERKTISFTEV